MSVASVSQVSRSLAALIASLSVAAIAVAALMLVSGLHDGKVAGRSAPTIDVSGTGLATARPDVATYRMELAGSGRTQSIAIEHLNQRTRKLTRAVRAVGIPADDIASSGTQTWDTHARRGRWRASAYVVVTVRKLTRTDDVLRVARRQPLTTLAGPDYSFADENDLREQAVADAVSSAKSKADNAARRAGMRVVGIASLEEGEVYVQAPGEPAAASRDAVAMSYESVAVTAKVGGELAVAHYSGKYEAHATISASFRLEDR